MPSACRVQNIPFLRSVHRPSPCPLTNPPSQLLLPKSPLPVPHACLQAFPAHPAYPMIPRFFPLAWHYLLSEFNRVGKALSCFHKCYDVFRRNIVSGVTPRRQNKTASGCGLPDAFLSSDAHIGRRAII